MKPILIMLTFFLVNARSVNVEVKYCAGSGGYNGQCSDIDNCQDSSFSFSYSCGFDTVCCQRSSKEGRIKVDKSVSQLATCGVSYLHLSHTKTAQVNRNVAKPGHFPWMVSFVYQKSGNGGNFCGGVLISSKHILTAGHCFAGVNPDVWRDVVGVRVGLADISLHAGYQPRIETIQIHPQYQNTSGSLVQPSHDIALVTLDREVPSTPHIGQICLPEQSRSKERIVRSVIAGWGATSSDQLQSVDQLRYGQVELVTTVECQRRYDNWGVSRVVIDKGMICAGGEQVDACAGDSGAPLMVQQSDKHWVVAGLVSFGPARCGSHVPGVYVKVREYLPWIYRAMSE